MSSLEEFVARAASLSFPNTFNPYSDCCDVFDYRASPAMRREMLTSVLRAAHEGGTDSLWIGRDLGYRGGRRTGLALTDQVHVEAHLQRWGIAAGERRVVKGTAQAERTASAIWQMLAHIETNVFLWNVFPLHPHEKGQPFTNRSHSSKERDAGEDILRALIRLLEPKRVVAIGRDAAESVARCTDANRMVAIRHPSYGGLRDFERGMRTAYRLAG